MQNILLDIEEFAKAETSPRLEGMQMVAILIKNNLQLWKKFISDLLKHAEIKVIENFDKRKFYQFIRILFRKNSPKIFGSYSLEELVLISKNCFEFFFQKKFARY